MDRPDTAALAAYTLAGVAALSCAFAPACPRWFRGWCALAGAFLTAWSAWAVVTNDWYLPDQWRLVPLAAPTGLIGATVLTWLRHQRQLRGLLPALPEIETPPARPERYPADVPLGELAPPHDPWKALYASMAEQRAKWSEALGDPVPAQRVGAARPAVNTRTR